MSPNNRSRRNLSRYNPYRIHERNESDTSSEDNNSSDSSDYLDEADGSFVTSTGVKKNPIKQYSSSGFISTDASSTFFFNPSPILDRENKDINEEVSIVSLYMNFTHLICTLESINVDMSRHQKAVHNKFNKTFS